MPTSTYTPLANITLSSSATSVTFSSISQAYRDLVLVIQAKATVTNNYIVCRVNSDTGNNYNQVVALNNGTSTVSYAYANQNTMYMYYPSWIGTSGDLNVLINFMDYSATDKHKTILSRGNAASSGTDMIANRWGSTSAITSISIYVDGPGGYDVGTTMALYGVVA